MSTRSVALGLLASAASAFDALSSTNVAMYWGQGNAQISLKDLCSDPSVDIVNMAFVNQFPKRRGEYPATNFANACDEVFYFDEFGNKSGLRSSCPTIPEGIQTCHDNGKKVLLSIGGGYPIDYYLESQDMAEYLADFLWGAFGPQDDEWVDQGKPRPFGEQYVDGFDLDLEALMDPAPFDGYEHANYHYLVSRWKNVLFPSKEGDFYISSAPQCVVPDSRLADAISQSHFDFIFAQFYNTQSCNARRGYEGILTDSTTFTFDKWVGWLNQHSANPNVKLYLGLPADKLAAPSDTTAYLEPIEANDVVTFYKNTYPDIFGGVMLWEATWNSKNTCSGTAYSTNIKAILQGSYQPEVCPSPTSSIASTSISILLPTAISQDGTCGPASGNTCAGSAFGECCSQYNFCGSSELYCSFENCNPLFGNCDVTTSSSVAPSITSSATLASSTSATSSDSTSSAAQPTGNPTPDGRCGPDYGGYDCVGYSEGECCSQWGYCGGSIDHCDAGCQTDFGKCGGAVNPSATISGATPTSTKSTNGRCGPEFPGFTCEGYHMGECCSPAGYCGASSAYCDAGCQSDFGKCTASNTTSSSAIPSIPLGTGASSIVTPSAFAPFPVNGNSTSVAFPSGTAPSIITPSVSAPFPTGNSSIVHPSGTGVSSSVIPSSFVPFPAGNSSIPFPTGTGVSVVTPIPIGTGASSIISAPYPLSNSSHSAHPTAASSPTESSYPVYTGPGYTVETSGAGEGYPAKSSQPANGQGYPVYTGPSYPVKSHGAGEGHDGYSGGKASVTGKPGYVASKPAVTTTCYTTTYVDICPTGFTTVTATVTNTYPACTNCVAPTPTPNEVPEGWYTTVAVCSHCGPKITTVTLTKPYATPTEAAYQPAHSSPAGAVPPYNVSPSSPAGQPQPPSKSKGDSNFVPAAHPSDAAYVLGTSAGEETVSITSKVYITVVPVPASEVPAATPAPYVAGNGTVPSGTASSAGMGAAAYTGASVPPSLYEGAASRFNVGVSGLVVLVAGVLLL